MTINRVEIAWKVFFQVFVVIPLPWHGLLAINNTNPLLKITSRKVISPWFPWNLKTLHELPYYLFRFGTWVLKFYFIFSKLPSAIKLIISENWGINIGSLIHKFSKLYSSLTWWNPFQQFLLLLFGKLGRDNVSPNYRIDKCC